MTNSQKHGKNFEDLIKGCGLFPGASDQSRSATAGMDIEARFDRQFRLPTSIKATGGGIITLSDARKFWAIDFHFRMIVGTYQQMGAQKHFGAVHEFLLTPTDLVALRGDVTLSEIEALHVGIGLAAFPVEQYAQARDWIKQQKRAMIARTTRIILNPKISSDKISAKNADKQRRMQCSVRLADLIAVTQDDNRHIVHTENIGDLVLPIALVSAKRKFGR
jgi:hypothetical protein